MPARSFPPVNTQIYGYRPGSTKVQRITDYEAGEQLRSGSVSTGTAAVAALLTSHDRSADAVAVETLVDVHSHLDTEQTAGEGEWGLVMRDRRAPVTADVEAGHGDEIR